MTSEDTYQRVTDEIVRAIDEGAGAYRMPWRTSGGYPQFPINAVSKKPYRGINILALWATAQERGYRSGVWATYRQWQELGAQVRRGEKSTRIVFWKFFDVEDEQDSAELMSKRIPMARDYFVFNSDQVHGYEHPDTPSVTATERTEHAERFFQALGATVHHGGNQAFYSASTDTIHMPAFEAFPEPLNYYSVRSHETTHWTASPNRLNRDLSQRFGTAAYAMEELIAELGAAFLCAELGLPSDPRTDHAPYINSWLTALRNDKRAIFTAAARAQEAVDWMMRRTGQDALEEAA